MTEWCKEHLAIIDAMSENQRKRAASVLRQHLIHAKADAERVGAKDKSDR